jgi:Zn finger protein HypA/HybF involved in hydrogenase expression
MASHGDYVMTPSRHSVVAGGLRGLEQRRQLTIERDPADHSCKSCGASKTRVKDLRLLCTKCEVSRACSSGSALNICNFEFQKFVC